MQRHFWGGCEEEVVRGGKAEKSTKNKIVKMESSKETTDTDKLEIDKVSKMFFGLFTNANQTEPDLSAIYTTCIPECIIVKKMEGAEIVYTLESFIAPRKTILSDGTLTEFEEHEVAEETKVIGNIAQRYSRYQKSGYLNGKYFKEYGHKFFQFVRIQDAWKINALIWEDDRA